MKCRVATGLGFALISFSVSITSVAATATPVERVVTLLKDLEAKLIQDHKEESQAYDKYACWCEKTTERKAHAITDGQDELRKFGQAILTLKGRIATLATEIEHHEMHIKANKKAQKSATNIRQKENAVYVGDTAEMKQAIVALQQAITVLTEGTLPGASLLQASTQASSAIRSVLGALPQQMSMAPGQIAELESFLEESSKSKYMPQSMTVQGILTDMYRTFAQDLETATMEEAQANRKYEDFINAQEVELARLEREKAKREAEKVEKESQLADTQQIYDDTAAQEKADIAFFDQTKQACLNKHDAWTARAELRQEEIDGIYEALDILTTDSARELFASAIKDGKEVGAQDSYDTGRDITAFLQERSVVSDEASAPMRAFAELKKQAASAHSFRLAALAVRVRAAKVGHFDKVLISIDDMIGTLQQEDADDIAKRDQCKDEYQKIASKIANVTWLIQKNEAKIDKLKRIIAKRTEQKHQTIDQINAVDDTVAELTRVREAENEAFLQAKTEDQNAIDLLIAARAALSRYYTNNSIELGPIQGAVKGLALQQQPDFDISADQAPDTVFSGKGKRKNEAKGILQILTTIIEDLNDEIRNDMKAEEEAQLEFEALTEEAAKLRKELVAKEVSLTAAIAKRGEEKTAENADKSANEEDLKEEQEYKASITDDCDFVIRTFEKRAAARAAEMRGLEGAKEFLAGYQKQSEAALLEKGSLPRPAFDDSALSRMKFLGVDQ